MVVLCFDAIVRIPMNQPVTSLYNGMSRILGRSCIPLSNDSCIAAKAQQAKVNPNFTTVEKSLFLPVGLDDPIVGKVGLLWSFFGKLNLNESNSRQQVCLVVSWASCPEDIATMIMLMVRGPKAPGQLRPVR